MRFVRLVEVFRQAALLRHAVAAVAVTVARRRSAPPRPQLAVHFLPREVEGRRRKGEGKALGALRGRTKGVARRCMWRYASEYYEGVLRGCTCQWWKKGSADFARAHVPNAVTFHSEVRSVEVRSGEVRQGQVRSGQGGGQSGCQGKGHLPWRRVGGGIAVREATEGAHR